MKCLHALAACWTWCDFWKNITRVPCLLIVSVIAARCLGRRLWDVLQDLLEKDWKSISCLYILTRTTLACPGFANNIALGGFHRLGNYTGAVAVISPRTGV